MDDIEKTMTPEGAHTPDDSEPGIADAWWSRARFLRMVNYVPLRLVDRDYMKWRKSKISPRKFRKIQQHLDRLYPPNRFSAAKLIGRDKEYNLLLDSFRLHVLKHAILKKWFDRDELPKAICLTGESGTGKTFLTLVSMKQMLLEAHKNGVLLSPIIIKGSDVFSEYYGRSTKQLSRLLEQAASAPSVVYIDEFQSFGKKVRGDTGTELEDTRVQDEINRWLDKIVSNDSRTLVIVATNSYEQTREDIRRRLTRVDLDSGVTREMLLAIVKDRLTAEGWRGISAEEIVEVLEREAVLRRHGSITPNDVLGVFREVKRAKEIPLWEAIRRSMPSPISKWTKPAYKVGLEDFAEAARSMKFYVEREKSREIMDAVYLVTPKVSRHEVGGLHDLRDKILNHISLAFSRKMSDLGYSSNCRFLLFGPPGTGKTLLALVAAAENKVAFIKVRGGELMSGATYIGEPEKRIKDLFALARQRSPCILFLDEADAIFWGADPTGNKILAQVKAELSEIKPDEGIVVIAASNKENLIDQATRDRFEPNVFCVHPPLNDQEWNEVVDIHLRKFRRFLHPEVDAAKITRLFRTQRILSPRAASETIAEAHRLWASEISAAYELRAAKDLTEKTSVGGKYAVDLERLTYVIDKARANEFNSELSSIDRVDESNYLIRLYHFEKAIQALESSQAKQRREMEEALILSSPTAGASFGLYASEDGTGGIITVQCSVRPLTPGESRVSVTGNSTSAVIGQLVLPDESVRQSAENAAEAVSSMLWAESRLDVSRLHVHFQIRSILEGAPGQGVSGPSAGLAMVLALLSELSGLMIAPSVVATGTIGVKLDVGPVGGLGGYGAQTGKIVGVLKSQRIRVTDLVLPAANFEVAADEMRILIEEGVQVHPVSTVSQCLKIIFGVGKEELVPKIRERVGTAATLTQLA
ncbi:MAG TPA: AAA family ATPase [Candidatus Dormibacteraeota bacterium]|nr:AAA family ATPase [Candidatus Dormibacteraeota bacterium]